MVAETTFANQAAQLRLQVQSLESQLKVEQLRNHSLREQLAAMRETNRLMSRR